MDEGLDGAPDGGRQGHGRIGRPGLRRRERLRDLGSREVGALLRRAVSQHVRCRIRDDERRASPTMVPRSRRSRNPNGGCGPISRTPAGSRQKNKLSVLVARIVWSKTTVRRASSKRCALSTTRNTSWRTPGERGLLDVRLQFVRRFGHVDADVRDHVAHLRRRTDRRAAPCERGSAGSNESGPGRRPSDARDSLMKMVALELFCSDRPV
jgi:hypothetical protein